MSHYYSDGIEPKFSSNKKNNYHYQDVLREYFFCTHYVTSTTNFNFTTARKDKEVSILRVYYYCKDGVFP